VPGDIARDGVVNSELTSAASGAARAPESSPLSAAMRERASWGAHLDAAAERCRAHLSLHTINLNYHSANIS